MHIHTFTYTHANICIYKLALNITKFPDSFRYNLLCGDMEKQVFHQNPPIYI